MSQIETTVILVRHADVHNPDDIVYGRLPGFRLSATGREEAERTAAALAATPLAALYTSPQRRARETARAIAARHPGLRPRVSWLLAEIRTGWQGRTNAEMTARRYNFYEPRHSPGDESLADIRQRMLAWFTAMLREHPGQTVAGVSHGDPVMVARLLFLGRPLTLDTLRDAALYPAKGSITRLVFAGQGDPLALHPRISFEDPNAAAHAGVAGAEGGTPWAAHSEEAGPPRG